MWRFNRTYGVEIECVLPAGVTRASLARDITAAGIPCEEQTLNHRVPSKWKTTPDRSVEGTRSGIDCELVSPPLAGEAGFKEVEINCSVLTQRRAQITTDCGLHVHIDARRPRELDLAALKRLALLYIENENWLDATQPQSRRRNENRFCKSIAHIKPELVEQAASPDDLATVLLVNRMPRPGENENYRRHFYDPRRYVKLNITSTWRIGTVEFRQHSGTTDPVKIRHWVTLAQAMVEKAMNPAVVVNVETVTAMQTLARRVRPGTLHERINTMLLSDQGATLREIIEATRSAELPEGWKAINIPRHGKTYGITVTSQKVHDPVAGRKVLRYFGRLTTAAAIDSPAPPSVLKPASVADFCQHIGLTETETSYFVGRATLFAGRPHVNR